MIIQFIISLLTLYKNKGLPCMFYSITGYYCPGCGGTRAVLALLSGHPWTSFCYHPLVIYCCAVILFYLIWWILFCFLHKSHKPIAKPVFYLAFVWIGLGILTANFLIKVLALFLFHCNLMPN